MLRVRTAGGQKLVAILLILGLSSICRAQQSGSIGTVWPLRIDSASGQIIVYQPQPEKFVADKLTARAAVSITTPPATEPTFGAMWMNARVATDRSTRTVTILDVDIKRVHFPDTTDDQQKQLAGIVQQQIPHMNVTFSLDELMTSLDVAQKEKVATEQLQTTPPKIIFTTAPAVLVSIDGDPQLQQTDQQRVMRVVNTPFILLFDESSRQDFLKTGDTWMSAPEVIGPYTVAQSVPPDVAAAASKLVAPPTDDDAAALVTAPANGPPPQIIVAETPAELISTDGRPTFTPLPGNDLLYMSNTQSDVFLEVATQENYVLLSGRWYRAPSLQGPWEYVAADKLPTVFAKIGPDSPKAHVLASIAGTTQAKEARLDARIPQTAAVSRDAGQNFSVTYDGDPQFDPIANSEVAYAVNTPDAVLRVGGVYYCCNSGVWYQAPTPMGPWTVCLSVPPAIYTIPPSCPDYYCRYCYVYDYTPDVVYCGYLPGYTGCYIYGPTIVFGTGFYYHGWFRHHYYPRPWTWGLGVRYDVRIGTWGFGATYRWNARWLALGGAEHGWWGPRGFVDYHGLPHVIGGKLVAGRANYMNRINVYNRVTNIRRDVVVGHTEQAGHEPARTEIRRSEPVAANNIYAGRDGEVYRRTDAGWEQRTGKGWAHVNGEPAAREEPARIEERAPERVAPQAPEESRMERPANSGLDAENAARTRGEERASDFHGGGGEVRGGGGESRGGGGSPGRR
jgi:hypothetical protein